MAIKISKAWGLAVRSHRLPLDLPGGLHFQMLKEIQCYWECYQLYVWNWNHIGQERFLNEKECIFCVNRGSYDFNFVWQGKCACTDFLKGDFKGKRWGGTSVNSVAGLKFKRTKEHWHLPALDSPSLTPAGRADHFSDTISLTISGPGFQFSNFRFQKRDITACSEINKTMHFSLL